MASLPLNEDQPKGEITLFLVSNGVHTDVVMPLKNDIFDWSDVVNPKDTLTADPQNNAYRFRLGGTQFLFIHAWVERFDFLQCLRGIKRAEPYADSCYLLSFWTTRK